MVESLQVICMRRALDLNLDLGPVEGIFSIQGVLAHVVKASSGDCLSCGVCSTYLSLKTGYGHGLCPVCHGEVEGQIEFMKEDKNDECLLCSGPIKRGDYYAVRLKAIPKFEPYSLIYPSVCPVCVVYRPVFSGFIVNESDPFRYMLCQSCGAPIDLTLNACGHGICSDCTFRIKRTKVCRSPSCVKRVMKLKSPLFPSSAPFSSLNFRLQNCNPIFAYKDGLYAIESFLDFKMFNYSH